MSTQPPAYTRPRTLDLDLLREIAALILILAGTIGLAACAFWWSPIAGWAAVSTVTLAAGVALGIERR